MDESNPSLSTSDSSGVVLGNGNLIAQDLDNKENFPDPASSITDRMLLTKRKATKCEHSLLRKSLAWNNAFFSEEGVLDPIELSILAGSDAKSNGLLSNLSPSSNVKHGRTLISNTPCKNLPRPPVMNPNKKISNGCMVKPTSKLLKIKARNPSVPIVPKDFTQTEKTTKRYQNTTAANVRAVQQISGVKRMPSNMNKGLGSSTSPVINPRKTCESPLTSTVKCTANYGTNLYLPPRSPVPSMVTPSVSLASASKPATASSETANKLFQGSNCRAKPSSLRKPSPSLGFFKKEKPSSNATAVMSTVHIPAGKLPPAGSPAVGSTNEYANGYGAVTCHGSTDAEAAAETRLGQESLRMTSVISSSSKGFKCQSENNCTDLLLSSERKNGNSDGFLEAINYSCDLWEAKLSSRLNGKDLISGEITRVSNVVQPSFNIFSTEECEKGVSIPIGDSKLISKDFTSEEIIIASNGDQCLISSSLVQESKIRNTFPHENTLDDGLTYKTKNVAMGVTDQDLPMEKMDDQLYLNPCTTKKVHVALSSDISLSGSQTDSHLKSSVLFIEDEVGVPPNSKSIDMPKVEPVSLQCQLNAEPFTDEWIAAYEAFGEDILKRKTGTVQNSPPDKTLPEPSPWSPVKRKNQDMGPYDCTKYKKTH